MGDSLLLFVWIAGCSLGLFAGRCIWKRPKLPYRAEDEHCPVCGYYCLGKGGVGCVDKPNLLEKGLTND